MDEKKKIKISFSTFFLIIAIFVIILMAWLMYRFYNEKDEPIIVNNESKIYLYSTVKGMYTGIAKDSYESDADRYYDLYLYENGTFKYENHIDIEGGVIGNYTIVNDKILLNYWFSTGSDAGLDAINGKKTLEINEDGSITDSNPAGSNSSNLILKKATSAEDNGQSNRIDFLINHYILSNDEMLKEYE